MGLSDNTTKLSQDLDVSGLSVGRFEVASGISARNSIGTFSRVSATTVQAQDGNFSNVSYGGFAGLPQFSFASLVAPFVVQPSASSFTLITGWAAVAPGDLVQVFPLPVGTVSSLSSGLVAHSHCTIAGQVEFRLSNVSTLAQNQSARTWVFVATRSGFTL